MQTSLIVVDDFLDNPDEFRAAALKLDYPEPEEATYFPGRNSAQRINLQGVEQQVSRLVGEPLKPAPSTGHGRFRITLANDQGLGDVHVDSQCHWSGIYYLSRPGDCVGGTDFFRHLPTGMERAPIHPEDLERLGMKSYDEVIEQIVKPHSRDRSQWEHTMRVPMRFNRLILLRPWLWHTAGPGFGDCLENGRLVYLTFFVRA